MIPSETASSSLAPASVLAPDDAVVPLEAAIAARRLRYLSQVGLALSAERDIENLLKMILSTSRELTASDGGTLYILEKGANGEKLLFFRASQNDSIVVDTNMSFAVSRSSLAGYAALTGNILRFDDVYHLPEDAPYKFNPVFDSEHNYRTQSVLVVPLKDHNLEVIGVLQLINRKRHRETLLRDPVTVQQEVIPFDDEMTELAATLASQAAVALNNTLLLREIEHLFESFVVAASSAIEDRDPTTSGHSRRVTNLTLALARAISENSEGPFADVRFTPAQTKELRYAALLHDFGKIGVRENVLVKSHKIEPVHFESILNRVVAARAQWQTETARAQVGLWRDQSLTDEEKERASAALDAELKQKTARLDRDTELLNLLNDPAADRISEQVWQEAVETTQRLTQLQFCVSDDRLLPLLQPEEAAALQVQRGTLTPDEFRQIQDHAQMSYEFLQQIPWTSSLENVPIIARSHHERSDGSGYPQGLRAQEIPLGARLMAISDVYDALTASDRPYKRAMTPQRALQILEIEAEHGKLDPDALAIFKQHEIWKLAGE